MNLLKIRLDKSYDLKIGLDMSYESIENKA